MTDTKKAEIDTEKANPALTVPAKPGPLCDACGKELGEEIETDGPFMVHPKCKRAPKKKPERNPDLDRVPAKEGTKPVKPS